ncbi:MAG TPA: LLM class flavin-dependent oxidoreductase [Actinomycetota bacterium]
MSLAAFVSVGKSLAEAVSRVQLAESLGYEAAFSTHTTGRDGLMTLAAYAAATKRIRLGTGVVPALPRHPLSLAIEAATLDEISGGRLILGVGPSHKVTMEGWYDIPMDKPYSQMREYVTILRQMFTTDGASFEGDFYKVQFGFVGYGARKDLPIYLSALAPKMLTFAGEACDGVILWSCLPSYIASTVTPTVRAAAEKAGRPMPTIVAAVPCAVTTNTAAAFEALRADFFVYMTLPFYRRAIAGAGYQAELDAFDKAQEAGDFPAALAAMSDAMLTEFAAIGDAAAIRDKIDEYRAAGVTLPAVGLFRGGDGYAGAEETLKAAAG